MAQRDSERGAFLMQCKMCSEQYRGDRVVIAKADHARTAGHAPADVFLLDDRPPGERTLWGDPSVRLFRRRAAKLLVVVLVAGVAVWGCNEYVHHQCRAEYRDYGDAPAVDCAGAWD